MATLEKESWKEKLFTMPKNKLILKAEIIHELNNIEKLYREIQKAKEAFNISKPCSLELVGLSGFLQSYYNGAVRIFKKIAREIDRNIPEGMFYHTALLNQMVLDIKDVRPPVLTQEVFNKLKLLLNFRYTFRHAYHWELQWTKVRELLIDSESIMGGLKINIEDFIEFIDELIKISETNNG